MPQVRAPEQLGGEPVRRHRCTPAAACTRALLFLPAQIHGGHECGQPKQIIRAEVAARDRSIAANAGFFHNVKVLAASKAFHELSLVLMSVTVAFVVWVEGLKADVLAVFIAELGLVKAVTIFIMLLVPLLRNGANVSLALLAVAAAVAGVVVCLRLLLIGKLGAHIVKGWFGERLIPSQQMRVA